MADDHLPMRVVKALVRRRKTPSEPVEIGKQELIDPGQLPPITALPPSSQQSVDVPPGVAQNPKAGERPVVVVFNQQVNIHHHNTTHNSVTHSVAPGSAAAPVAAPPVTGPRPRLFRPAVMGEMVEQAGKMRRDGVMRLLKNYYPMVYRLAAGLSGKEKSALKIARVVVNRSFRAMPSWNAPTEAENWFLRNTIQVWRQGIGARGNADCLISGKDGKTTAFVRGLRGLPFQQVEAFILQYGERLESRSMAVAMDCSMSATANHLSAANRTLQTMAGEEFNRLAANMADAYALLEPEVELVEEELAWPVTRKLAARRIARLILTAVVLGLLAGAAWLAWKVVPRLSY